MMNSTSKLSCSALAILLPVSVMAQGRPLELSLKSAIDIALAPEGNVRIQLAERSIRQAEARSAEARSALLPSIDASVSEQNLTRNLRAFGIELESPIPGLQIPALAGPFNVFDARASGTQTVFNFSSIRRYQASRASVGAASADSDATQNQVAHQVAVLYFTALRAQARVEAEEANVKLAQSLVELAVHQKAAGTGTGIEVTRAEVQLANELQSLLVAENERRQAQLQLLKAMGVRLDTPLRFAHKLSYTPTEELTPESALAIALESRADLRAQQKREESARLTHSGSKMERLPSVSAFGDYGSIGTGLSSAIPTRTYGLSVRVPLFDGGRLEARRSESRSQYEQERIRTADLRQQIELEIRLSLDSLHSAEQQVKVAEEGLAQVQQELEQAQRRYRAGVADGLEVTDAQTRLARARDNHIAALSLYNQARVNLGQAMGTIQKMVD
jgi:outer membrane protein